MYILDIILDKSDKPKLSGIKRWQVISICIIFILFVVIALIAPMLMQTFGITDTGIAIMIATLSVVLTILIFMMIMSESKFKKKHAVHGELTLDFFNGKEVGVFKSNYNEKIVIDFENIITSGIVSKTQVNNRLERLKITNRNTTVLYNGQLIKCAIALYIKDNNLISYLIRNGYITK